MMNRLRSKEAGYSLITTMLVITIFFLLGLTVLSVAIQQARVTEVRVEDVESLHEAKTALDEAIGTLKAKLSAEPNQSFFTEHQIFSPADLDRFLNDVQNELKQQYDVSWEDISYDEYNIPTNKVFIRAVDLSKTFADGSRQRTVKRRVFLTNTPSFLKYALGSKENVIINGGAYIEQGDVYAGNEAYVSNATNYIRRDGTLETAHVNGGLAASAPGAIWYVNSGLLSCNNQEQCYKREGGRFIRQRDFFSAGWPENAAGPVVQKENEDFIDVDFDWTVKDKLLNAAGISPVNDQQEYVNWINNETYQTPQQLADQLKKEGFFTVIVKNDDTPIAQIINDTTQQTDRPLWLEGDIDIADFDSLTIKTNGDEKQWLIVNGNLRLYGPSTKSADSSTVRGNLIVFGNLELHGNISFNSTVYVLGTTYIYNAKISEADQKELVLLSKGMLDIARINEFENPDTANLTPNLKGYFYTDNNATIYAVGSYLYIEGGLFARGGGICPRDNDWSSCAPDADLSGLVINAFRGQVQEQNDEPGQLERSDEQRASRLIVKYNPNVLVDQGEGLPFVHTLSLVVEELVVQ